MRIDTVVEARMHRAMGFWSCFARNHANHYTSLDGRGTPHQIFKDGSLEFLPPCVQTGTMPLNPNSTAQDVRLDRTIAVFLSS